ncbi:MAG: hypothetical protein AAFY20_23385 [Cyanobacteria bacterium J06639_14]
MAKTTEKQSTRDGTSARNSYTAEEIATACLRSDRWVRTQRETLETIYYWCPEHLKSSDGSYTEWAFEQIKNLQLHTSTKIPKENKGKLKLEANSSRISIDQYRSMVWDMHGKLGPNLDEDLDSSAELPPGTSARNPDETEIIDLEFDEPDSGETVADSLDNALAVNYSTASNLANLQSRLLAQYQQLGESMGAMAVEAMSTGFHQVLTEGMTDVVDVVAPTPKAKTIKKVKRTKA